MRILISGAGGQLGRSLIRVLTGHEITALTHDELDITDYQMVCGVVRDAAPSVIINAAAYNNVDAAETQLDEAEKVNSHGPRNLALAGAASSIPIVHISTDYVFDGRAGRPYSEADTPNPLSAYGRSKLAGEIAVKEANPRHFIVRTAWLYEEHGQNFLRAMRERAGADPVRVVADQYGSPTYAPYLAGSIAKLIRTDSFGIYHIAGAGGTSRCEWVRYFYRLLGITTEIIPINQSDLPSIATRPIYSVLTSIRNPAFALPPWQEGLRAYVGAIAPPNPTTAAT